MSIEDERAARSPVGIPLYTFENLPFLDKLHEEMKVGDWWRRNSHRRAIVESEKECEDGCLGQEQ